MKKKKPWKPNPAVMLRLLEEIRKRPEKGEFEVGNKRLTWEWVVSQTEKGTIFGQIFFENFAKTINPQ